MMKVKTKYEPEENKFRNCSVTITMENQGEFDMIYTLFNSPEVCGVTRNLSTIEPSKIRELLNNVGIENRKQGTLILNALRRQL